MSSKKARRRKEKERQRERERRRSGLNPVTLFILGIAAAILVLVVGAVFFGGGADPGAPPWPGAVWSSAHGHWH